MYMYSQYVYKQAIIRIAIVLLMLIAIFPATYGQKEKVEVPPLKERLFSAISTSTGTIDIQF